MKFLLIIILAIPLFYSDQLNNSGVSVGSRVAIAGEKKSSRLIAAAKAGDAEMVSNMLNNGLKVDTADWAGWTSLHWASLLLKNNVIKVLLKFGADIERVGEGGKNSGTPLMMASKKYYGLKTVQFLLMSGANVNGEDQYGRTPLIIASRYGRLKIVRMLIEYGANVKHSSKLNSWKTALKVAEDKGHIDIAIMLRNAGALK